MTPLDRDKAWPFEPRLKVGESVAGGDILGVVPETSAMEHRVLVPPGVAGEIIHMAEPGVYTLKESIARVKDAGAGRRSCSCGTAGRCARPGLTGSACCPRSL